MFAASCHGDGWSERLQTSVVYKLQRKWNPRSEERTGENGSDDTVLWDSKGLGREKVKALVVE